MAKDNDSRLTADMKQQLDAGRQKIKVLEELVKLKPARDPRAMQIRERITKAKKELSVLEKL